MTRYQPARSDLPTETSLLVAYLEREKAFPCIGKKRAAELGRTFGAGLKDAILRVDDGVIKIVGEEPALAAAAAMEVRQEETAFLEWLDSVGARIQPHKAIRIARAWGAQGAEAVQTNPYLLLAVSDWKSVDHVAQVLGVVEP